MSDLDKLFENAPEGAVAIKRTRQGKMFFINRDGYYYHGSWKTNREGDKWKTIATRPQPEQEKDGECYAVQMKNLIKEAKANGFELEQVGSGVNWRKIQPRKTVEDAVDWANSESGNTCWPSDSYIGISYSEIIDDFAFYMGGSLVSEGISKEYVSVCTREEFEACVAAEAAKSEPEWTHEINGLHCKVLNDKKDCLGNIVVELHGSGYATPQAHTVKPIKPTITKADEDALIEFMKSSHNLDVINEVRAYINNCTITD